jgi:hypothetical protein
MTAREIAARLHAKPSGKTKWTTRCPAHNDRRPSLAIAEGRDGRALLFCHAGCEIDAVAWALGVEVCDFFADDAPAKLRSPRRTLRRPPNAAELRDALRGEADVYRAHHGIVGELLTEELRHIRTSVAMRYGVELPPILRPTHEGGYGGRERDAAWPALFERALTIATIELLGAPLDFAEFAPPRAVLLRAEELAAADMADVERAGGKSLREEAA